MNEQETKHEHDWRPLTYYEGEGDSAGEVALWACAGRTRYGKCLATRTAAEVARDIRKQQAEEAEARAEQEQRHWNWEKQ